MSDTMSDNENTFDIPAYNFDPLADKIDKLNRRAPKLGCEPIVLRVVREYEVERENRRTRLKYMQQRMEIEVVGESPRFEGWTLLAAIEMQENGENLVRAVPGQTVPEAYRNTDTHCDHCQTQRYRKEVFVLGHEDGRTAQVGRQCIADFLGHVSAATLAGRAEWEFSALDAAREAEDDDYYDRCGYRGERTRDITEFLGVVAICCRRLGWVSRSMLEKQGRYDEQTTASWAWQVITYQLGDRYMKAFIEKNALYAEERDTTLAREALEWGRSFPTTGVNDYEYNLGVACRQNTVNIKTIGIVGSVISAYMRHLERQEELVKQRKKNADRKHLGTVGERRGFAGCEIKTMKYFEGRYGVKTLVRFETPDGDVLIWWASKELDCWNVGDTVGITGTVTKHGDYKGCPQTELKRVAEGLPKAKKPRKQAQRLEKAASSGPVLALEAPS